MDWAAYLLDLLLHLDRHLLELVQLYGSWIYAILFAIVFCETGLVVTPFLPGDSLLFITGTLAGAGMLDPLLLAGLLVTAAFLGDAVNYRIGAYIGPKVYGRPSRWLNPRHLQRAHEFFERHGGKTIVIARFLPIIRTYAPFVAGVAQMPYRRFALFNLSGGVLWVASLIYAGVFFGHLPLVRNNLTLITLGIIVLSLLPAAVGLARAKLSRP